MARTKEEILEQISTIIEENINPAVASHGGMIKLEDFDEETGSVLVMLSGGCSGCASSTITLKMGVENMLKHYVPEVMSVEGMDDPNYNDPFYRADNGAGYGPWDPHY
jgi:Fe-S cluster biogenesis protein NfuA